MKLLKKMKKGFTLVELIVVIAVIATLAAVSVGVYFGVTDSAKKSNDQTVTNQMNKALLLDQTVNGQPKTPTDALDVLAKNGFVVTEMSPFQDGAYYLWDSVDNKMILINKAGEVDFPEDATIRKDKDFEYFTFVRADNDKPAGHNYSYYLKDNYVGNANFTAGFDTGVNSSLTTTTYSNTESNAVAQDVIIRNNGESLVVNGPKDTVEHYGTVKDLTITSVDSTDCYHEHGYVANFKTFGTGKFIAESTAQFHQIKAEVESVLNGKTYELSSSAQYGVHKYNPTTGECEFCTATDPNNPNVEPPVVEEEETGIPDVNPQLKLYEEANGALTFRLDKSDMKEYANQVDYYEVIFSNKYVVTSEKYGINEEFTFELKWDNRNGATIPYFGNTDYGTYVDLFGAKTETLNDTQYTPELDYTNPFLPRRASAYIVLESIVKKALVKKGCIKNTDTVDAKLQLDGSYEGGGFLHFYLNLLPAEYENIFVAKNNQNPSTAQILEQESKIPQKVFDADVNVANVEDRSKYIVKAYGYDGTLLGKNTYDNAHTQMLNGEDIALYSSIDKKEFETKKILNNLDGYGHSNTFGFYKYAVEYDKYGNANVVTKKI